MRAAPGEWDCLHGLAKASDREKAAEPLRPAFEERLRELGYSPLAIAHAFSSLTGAHTVEEALAELKENERLERIVPVSLDFDTVEHEPGLPVGHSLTITGVERDGRGIRIAYEIRPPLPSQRWRPRVEARDDCGHEYRHRGGGRAIGSQEFGMAQGGFTVPLPQPHISLLHVRMSWSKDSTSLWQDPAHELRIPL